jgi:hypothetical protein
MVEAEKFSDHPRTPLGVPFFLPALPIGSPLLYKPRNIEVLHTIFVIVSLIRSSSTSSVLCSVVLASKIIRAISRGAAIGLRNAVAISDDLLVRCLVTTMTISIVVLYSLRRHRNAFKQPADQF